MNISAVFCSDIHLSHRPPVSRSAEPDWYAAMGRPLAQVRKMCVEFNCPLIIAGDVFDRWNSPPELINFAIDEFSQFRWGVYAIPGQHDLPEHSNEQRHRSAYGCLERAGVIDHLELEPMDLLWIHPFGWGVEVKPYFSKGKHVNVAIIHAFVWKPGTGYPGVSEDSNVVGWGDKLKGYDWAIFGDNHKGFEDGKIFNCGTLMRRKLDERQYRPRVGVLDDGGKLTPHYLDVSEDKWIDDDSESTDEAFDYSDYIKSLGELGSDSLDFREVVRKRMDDKQAAEDVRRLVSQALDEERKK